MSLSLGWFDSTWKAAWVKAEHNHTYSFTASEGWWKNRIVLQVSVLGWWDSVMLQFYQNLHLPLNVWLDYGMLTLTVKEQKSLCITHGSWLLWFFLVNLSNPCMVQASIFRVGVLGPWSCDSVFAKAMPGVAAKLAVQRINRDQALSLGITFDYVILEEDCQTSIALKDFMGYYPRASAFLGPINPGYCEAASLLTRKWNKALFSWSCVNYELESSSRHPTFSRTIPSPIWVLKTVAQQFHWANIAIVASTDYTWVDTSYKVADALRSYGFPVRTLLSSSSDPASIRRSLSTISKMKELRSKWHRTW